IIKDKRENIKNILISNGIKEKQSVEDANYLLPRATNTSLCIAFTLEALIHYMHKRLCARSQYFHRKIAKLMKEEVVKVLPEVEDRLVPACKYLLWCPEKNMSCGRMPTKNELLEKLKMAE
ncbi:MAG: FAD-dependent thymidylate synthase, partial [Clostridia bacterium]|nr:FAD-dependent thymidylate synthase [Clostridia bacterium]